MPDTGVTALWNRKGVVCENSNIHTHVPSPLYLVPSLAHRRIKNAIIGNQTKKSSFMLLGVIPRLVCVGTTINSKPVGVVCITWVH